MARQVSLQIACFASDLGWMTVVGTGETVYRIGFGYPSRAAALNALDSGLANAEERDWCPSLVARLQEFASGHRVDFGDVKLQLDHLTPFQRRTVKHCRAIAYGKTRSYGELAALSGSERAARAVGSTMASNRFPIVVPCHRVINSDGSPGNYSAVDGVRMKIRLLAMEQGLQAPASPTKPALTHA
jgi:methylated-DNA-[protein]-cysteine S-methyltransferase